jgi:hypothetical protein
MVLGSKIPHARPLPAGTTGAGSSIPAARRDRD